MNISNLKAVMKGVGIVEISAGKVADYFPEKFISQYRICGSDEIYVPISWLKSRDNKNSVYDKKPVAYSEAALQAEKIIRHIDEKMVSEQYPIKPSYSHRAGRPVFKWGTGRYMPHIPRHSWIRAFAKFYKFDHVALCLIRRNPRRDMYSAMVFFRDNAVSKA